MKSTAAENIIELKNVSKSFDGKNMVVNDFNLEVKKGEFVTFLGPSGCGKTTILRMIAGFEMPSEGEIFLDGKKINSLPPNHRPVNTVFQKYELFSHLNIYENIAFGLKLKKLPKAVIDEKVRHALEIVDLEGFEKRDISTLSGGQQQRIAIARAIVNEPEILLLDEPLAALDSKMRKEMQLELKNMHEELGITFIFVTHDQEEALTMSDKIVVMSNGVIQQVGTPEEIYNEPSNIFVADFIGDSNIFDGKMTAEKTAEFCGTEFECVDDYPAGMPVDAVIRPEDVELVSKEEGIISGKVISSIFKGIFYEVTILSGKNEIVSQSTRSYGTDLDTEVGIYVKPDNIHIIPRDMSINHFEGKMETEGKLVFEDGSCLTDDMMIFGSDTELASLPEGTKLLLSFSPDDVELSDDYNMGMIRGRISSIIYKGDHYSYTVRTKNENNYYVNEEDLWNLDDDVSIVIPPSAIICRLEEEME